MLGQKAGQMNFTGAHPGGSGRLSGLLPQHLLHHMIQLPLRGKDRLLLPLGVQPSKLKSGIVLIEIDEAPCQLIQRQIPAVCILRPVDPDGSDPLHRLQRIPHHGFIQCGALFPVDGAEGIAGAVFPEVIGIAAPGEGSCHQLRPHGPVGMLRRLRRKWNHGDRHRCDLFHRHGKQPHQIENPKSPEGAFILAAVGGIQREAVIDAFQPDFMHLAGDHAGGAQLAPDSAGGKQPALTQGQGQGRLAAADDLIRHGEQHLRIQCAGKAEQP